MVVPYTLFNKKEEKWLEKAFRLYNFFIPEDTEGCVVRGDQLPSRLPLIELGLSVLSEVIIQ
jgi:hypothetical protein